MFTAKRRPGPCSELGCSYTARYSSTSAIGSVHYYGSYLAGRFDARIDNFGISPK